MSQVRKKSVKKKFVGKVEENGIKVSKNSYFDKYFQVSFGCDRDAASTHTGILKRFSKLGKGGPQKN